MGSKFKPEVQELGLGGPLEMQTLSIRSLRREPDASVVTVAGGCVGFWDMIAIYSSTCQPIWISAQTGAHEWHRTAQRQKTRWPYVHTHSPEPLKALALDIQPKASEHPCTQATDSVSS